MRGMFGRRRPSSVVEPKMPPDPIDITVMGWRVVFHGGEFHVSHDNTPLTITDAITSMPVWGPLVIEELGRITHVLRDQITKPVTMGILPIESAPRDGTEVDLWVVPNVDPARKPKPERIAGCTYNLQRQEAGRSHYGWSSYHNGRSGSVSQTIVGWTPIPKP